MENSKKSASLWMYPLMAIPFIYLAIIWSSIPETIGTHFNIEGEADRYGNKSFLIYITSFLIGFTFLLYKFIPKIDPKKRLGSMGNTYDKLMFALMGFMVAISIFIIYTSAVGGKSSNKILYAIMGLFFMALGNYLPTIKPNYFIGLRTPWTLESEVVWRKMHRIAGPVYMVGGLIITLTSLILEPKLAFYIFMGFLLVSTLVLVVLSYIVHQRNEG